MASTPAAGRGAAPGPTVSNDFLDIPREQFYAEQAAAYVVQLEAEIETIAAKIDGMKATLAAKREELKTARKVA